ncbi:MAG: hypothetical protein WAK38_12965 [Trebonia sp.]
MSSEPITVVGQPVTVADREPVDRVGGLEAVLVVHGDRPERVRGRQFAGREVAQVFAAPAQRRAVGVGFQQRVDGVF